MASEAVGRSVGRQHPRGEQADAGRVGSRVNFKGPIQVSGAKSLAGVVMTSAPQVLHNFIS